MATAKTVAEVVLGEAAAGDFQDMLAVASVIHNRAQQLGVSMDDVVSVKSQFNAYGKALPSGALSNLGLAQKALDYVASFGPVHNATFFATPSKTSNLPSGLQQETRTKGHVYYSDPQNRSIKTAQGFMKPSASNAMQQVSNNGKVSVSVNGANIEFEGTLTRLPDGSIRATPAPNATFADEKIADAQARPVSLPSGQRLADGTREGVLPGDLGKLQPPNVSQAMNPIFGAMGASRLTKDAAPYNMSDLIGQQYDTARRHYEMVTGTQFPPINDAVAKKGTSREKDTKGSMHFQGKALDISTRGLSDFQQLALEESLKAAGFKGFGYGPSILHADIGLPRSWSYPNGPADWASARKNASLENISVPGAPVPTPSPLKSAVAQFPSQTSFAGPGVPAGAVMALSQPRMHAATFGQQTPFQQAALATGGFTRDVPDGNIRMVDAQPYSGPISPNLFSPAFSAQSKQASKPASVSPQMAATMAREYGDLANTFADARSIPASGKMQTNLSGTGTVKPSVASQYASYGAGKLPASSLPADKVQLAPANAAPAFQANKSLGFNSLGKMATATASAVPQDMKNAYAQYAASQMVAEKPAPKVQLAPPVAAKTGPKYVQPIAPKATQPVPRATPQSITDDAKKRAAAYISANLPPGVKTAALPNKSMAGKIAGSLIGSLMGGFPGGIVGGLLGERVNLGGVLSGIGQNTGANYTGGWAPAAGGNMVSTSPIGVGLGGEPLSGVTNQFGATSMLGEGGSRTYGGPGGDAGK